MKTNWDLTVFYKDFDDPAFKADLGGLDASIAALTEAVAAPSEDEAAKLTALVGQVEALGMTFERLMLMVELTLSVDAQNKPANAAMAPLMRSAMLMEQANNALGRYLSKLENLSELVHSNETLSARAFALLEMAENAKHQLPEALEEPVMKMQLSGGQAFSQLRDKLDATLTVDYDGKAIPLSAARAMAYDADAAVRRKAYDAELASYKKIEIPMSYCLNNIKAEGETMAKLRGYKGVLDMALAHFRMDEKTLDAMWTAIREALPEPRKRQKDDRTCAAGAARVFQGEGSPARPRERPAVLRSLRPGRPRQPHLHRRGGARAAARPVRPLLPGDGRHDARRV